MFTKDERDFLVRVLAQVSVNATDPQAAKIVALVASISDKLRQETP